MDALKTDAAERPHHPFGMSKLNYLAHCAGYTSRLGTSEAAEEGQAQHEVMDQVAEYVKAQSQDYIKTGDPFTRAFQYEVAPNHVLDEADTELLTRCCREVDRWIAKLRGDVVVHNEIKVSIPNPDGSELNHGYLDLLLTAGDVGVLLDYKFGFLPVTPAETNLQGLGYGLAVLLRFLGIQRLAIKFIQPKLKDLKSTLITRDDIPRIYGTIAGVIERATKLQANPTDPQGMANIHSGDYCRFCKCAGDCSVYVGKAGVLAKAVADGFNESLPVPAVFTNRSITSPEQIALARYWVDLLEPMFDEVKKRTVEAVVQNGGSLECRLPDGRTVTYTEAFRGVPRVLGEAPLIAEALADIVSEKELLAAAKFTIGDLETVAGGALQESVNTGVDAELQKAQSVLDLKLQGGQITKKEHSAQSKALAKDLKAGKLTKKAATEKVCSLLEANGLLSRPDTQIAYLKRSITKQLTDGKEVQ